MPALLIVPGRSGSGAAHWQSEVERHFPGARRVQQADWDHPDLTTWAQNIAAAARAFVEPPLAIAHSFGCLALAHAALRFQVPLAGSFMVAPADPQRFGIADREVLGRLGHPSSLVASTDDPWLRFDRNRELAKAWGSRLHVLGAVGHINVDSGFGPWPDMLRWAAAGRVDFPEFAAGEIGAAG